MRSTRGRRWVWRAARRATEQARDEDGAGEVQRLAEEWNGSNGGEESPVDEVDWTLCGSCNSCENQPCFAGDRFVVGVRQTQDVEVETFGRSRGMAWRPGARRWPWAENGAPGLGVEHIIGSSCIWRQCHMACIRKKSFSASTRTETVLPMNWWARLRDPPLWLTLNKATSVNIAWQCQHCIGRGVMKLHRFGAASCRGSRSACVEDVRINRRLHPGFFEKRQDFSVDLSDCVNDVQINSLLCCSNQGEIYPLD